MKIEARRPHSLRGVPQLPDTSTRPEVVDAVINVKSPDMEWLDQTLGSLEAQTHQPRVTIVDCMDPPVEAETTLETQVLQSDRCHRAVQRRQGIQATDGDAILHLDEDSVLTQPDHIEYALTELARPEVSAVGGAIEPLRDNPLGRLAARLTPIQAYFPLHHRSACPDGEACFPRAHDGEFHNDDRMLKERLYELGDVIHCPYLVVRTDLPTRKQKAGLGLAGAAALVSGKLF